MSAILQMCSEQGGVLPLFLGTGLYYLNKTNNNHNQNKANFLLAFLVATSDRLMVPSVSALLGTAEKHR